jgi:NitT/TauT family transport system substrate-binding protein
MRSALTALAIWLIASGAPASAETILVKVGWAAPVISAASTPFAVAQKMGWFEASGIRLQLLATQGSVDLAKQIATGDILFGFPSVEPLVILRPQGVKAKMFYTAFQGNSYGLAVPADSPIHDFTDLKGKSIGVPTMGSASVVIARALVADAGLDPQKDVRIVAVGEAGQTAAMLRGKQVDALSEFDAGYAMIENAGVKLRYMDKSKIAHFPSNGLLALEQTLVDHRAEAVALGQGLAKGTVFMLANPEAAVRMLFDIWPQMKPTGVDDEAAMAGALRQVQAVMHVFPLAQSSVTKWGESSLANYDAYVDFLVKWGVAKQKVPATDLVTNDLIEDINKFDADAITTQAKAYKP